MSHSTASITTPREFTARRLAQSRLIAAGDRAHAHQASRLAARLYKAGASVDRAAREAAQTVQALGHYTAPGAA